MALQRRKGGHFWQQLSGRPAKAERGGRGRVRPMQELQRRRLVSVCHRPCETIEAPVRGVFGWNPCGKAGRLLQSLDVGLSFERVWASRCKRMQLDAAPHVGTTHYAARTRAHVLARAAAQAHA
eukprot:6002036-Pleurochrysis_carterae.AAC.1